jgi:hypothetical protein
MTTVAWIGITVLGVALLVVLTAARFVGWMVDLAEESGSGLPEPAGPSKPSAEHPKAGFYSRPRPTVLGPNSGTPETSRASHYS